MDISYECKEFPDFVADTPDELKEMLTVKKFYKTGDVIHAYRVRRESIVL